MTEKSLINYNELARSYDIAIMNQGILPAGRYAGFDAISLVSLEVDHVLINFTNTVSGFTAISSTNTTKANQAKIVTPEGVIIEYEVIDNVQIEFETTGEPRVDTIVIDHDWEEVAGGQPSTISVIKGTPSANPTAPALTNPTTQTKIGEVLVAANGDEFADLTYTKNPTPLPGNEDTMAFLELITALQNDKLDKVEPILSIGTPFVAAGATVVPEWGFANNETILHKDERGWVTFGGKATFNRTPSTSVTSPAAITMLTLDAGFRPNRPTSPVLYFSAYNETTGAECNIKVAANGDVSFIPSQNTNVTPKISTGDVIYFYVNWWAM